MAIKIEITSREKIYIDGKTGEQLTPEQWMARYNRYPPGYKKIGADNKQQ